MLVAKNYKDAFESIKVVYKILLVLVFIGHGIYTDNVTVDMITYGHEKLNKEINGLFNKQCNTFGKRKMPEKWKSR